MVLFFFSEMLSLKVLCHNSLKREVNMHGPLVLFTATLQDDFPPFL